MCTCMLSGVGPLRVFIQGYVAGESAVVRVCVVHADMLDEMMAGEEPRAPAFPEAAPRAKIFFLRLPRHKRMGSFRQPGLASTKKKLVNALVSPFRVLGRKPSGGG